MTSMAPQQHMQPRDQGRSARVVVVVLGRSVLAHLVDEGGHLFTCKPVQDTEGNIHTGRFPLYLPATTPCIFLDGWCLWCMLVLTNDTGPSVRPR